jgi:hypothetical protein
MDTLDKLTELNNDILPKLKGDERIEPKAKLNSLIMAFMEIKRDELELEKRKTNLAIESNTDC